MRVPETSLLSADVLPSLLVGLYGVTAAPTLWRGWLAQLCDAAHAQAALVVLHLEPGVAAREVVTVGLDGASPAPSPGVTSSDRPARAPLLAELSEDARLVPAALELATGDPVAVSIERFPDPLLTTRLHREWLAPRGLEHLAAMIVARSAGRLCGIAMLRDARRSPFSPSDLDLLRRLQPHLARVIEVEERCGEADRTRRAAERLLDSLRCGALVVDGCGRVRDANRRAAALLERRDGIALEGGILRAEDARETQALRRLIRLANVDPTAGAGGVLALSRAAHPHALVVSVSPLVEAGAVGGASPPPSALLLLGDPDEPAPLPEATLRRLYGLTDAEARVASRLARGETLEDIAAALDVGRATVRSQLQQVLAKTRTHRQADLVRVLLLGVGSLPAPTAAPPR